MVYLPNDYQFGEDIADDNDFIREYNEQLNNTNSTVQALILANVVDEILRNYGNALEVDYDLTNMSNMVMSNVSHSTTTTTTTMMIMDNSIKI